MINLYCIRPKGLNIGNDVIYQSMKYYLYKIFGYDLNIIVIPATARYETQILAGLTAKTIYEINQHGHGVLIGGGNLYENNELDINLDAFEKLEVPLMLFSLSRGHIFNRWGKKVSRTDTMPDRTLIALNNKTKHAYARDQATLNYLHQIGCEHVQLSACPSIFIDRLTDYLPKLPDHYSECALISIRNPSLMSIPPHDQVKVHEDIRQIIEYCKQQSIKDVRILCHDSRDISYASSFQGIDYIYTTDLYLYLALLKKSRIHITYRLHSFLPCLAWDVPVIKISYDERALSLVDTIGYGSWNINMLTENSLIDAVRDRYTKLDKLQSIKNKAEPLWNQFDRLIYSAFQKFYEDIISRM